jgi:hypothetical protein
MIDRNEILREVSTLPVGVQRRIAREIEGRLRSSESHLGTDKKVAMTLSLLGSLRPEGGEVPLTKGEARRMIEEILAKKYS